MRWRSSTALSLSAQESFSTGQNIAPAYEGWEKNADGSFNLVFGYFNRNWEEEIDAPLGPANTIEPGGPDRGQPTHFLPRRNRFVFRIRVPADFGTKELVWTLTTNGKTERAYATLKPDYFIDDDVIMANNGAAGMGGADPALKGNKPPVADGRRDRRRGRSRSGKPSRWSRSPPTMASRGPRAMPPLNPGVASRFTVDSATGLRLSWFVYRGNGKVVFDPVQTKVWEDTQGQRELSVVLRVENATGAARREVGRARDVSRAGTYVLRCQAHDGGLATTGDVTFVVK